MKEKSCLSKELVGIVLIFLILKWNRRKRCGCGGSSKAYYAVEKTFYYTKRKSKNRNNILSAIETSLNFIVLIPWWQCGFANLNTQTTAQSKATVGVIDPK
jgi:hypothetical protein